MLIRGDVEIANGNDGIIFLVVLWKPLCKFIKKGEFMCEFFINCWVWVIAASRDVQIVNINRLFKSRVRKARHDMAAIFLADTVMYFFFIQREFGQYRDTVITFHAVDVDVLIRRVFERLERKMLIRCFCFLQA